MKNNEIDIEVFNFNTGLWEKQRVTEAEEVLNEIDKMQELESIGLDYRNALIEIVDLVVNMKLDKITPMRN